MYVEVESLFSRKEVHDEFELLYCSDTQYSNERAGFSLAHADLTVCDGIRTHRILNPFRGILETKI